jgi:CheY-like chemotaxis protein
MGIVGKLKKHRFFNRDAREEPLTTPAPNPGVALSHSQATGEIGAQELGDRENSFPEPFKQRQDKGATEHFIKPEGTPDPFFDSPNQQLEYFIDVEEPQEKGFDFIVHLPAEATLPAEMQEFLRTKRLAFIGFDKTDSNKILRTIEPVGIFSHFFNWTDALPSTAVFRHFHMLILNALTEDSQSLWMKLKELARYKIPILLAGSAQFLFQHSTEIRKHTRDFMFTPWHDEEILLRVYHLLSEIEKQRAAATQSAANERPRVVIADDDPTTTVLISTILKKNGMECFIANNGMQAVELVKAIAPQAAIFDINIPHLDGFEVLAALKNDAQTSGVPVILLTARQQETDIIRAFALGTDDYLTKPFNPMELLARLQRLLKKPSISMAS